MATRKFTPAQTLTALIDRMDVALAVIQSVVDSLSVEDNNHASAKTLLECALYPLQGVRESLVTFSARLVKS